MEAAHSTISSVSTLAGLIDKKAGQDIAIVGESALQIADSLRDWLHAVAGLSALDKVTSLSTVVMTGNVLARSWRPVEPSSYQLHARRLR